MNKKVFFLLTAIAVLIVSSSNNDKPREVANFNEGWSFNLGDIADASPSDVDDSEWRSLNLPHYWSIEGSFSEEHPAGSC